jgi:hypothetical protein
MAYAVSHGIAAQPLVATGAQWATKSAAIIGDQRLLYTAFSSLHLDSLRIQSCCVACDD